MSDTIKVMVPPVDWPLSKWEATAETLKEFGWREVTLRRSDLDHDESFLANLEEGVAMWWATVGGDDE